MKKENLLKIIDEKINVNEDEQATFEFKIKFKNRMSDLRKKIDQIKTIALDLHESLRTKVDMMDQINLVSVVQKVTLAFGHLGTAIKKNSGYNPIQIVGEYMKSNIDLISETVLQDVFEELLKALYDNPEHSQADSYIKDLEKNLEESEWTFDVKYNAKKKHLPESYEGGNFPDEYRNFFVNYIKFRNGLKYPYASVVNSALDVKGYIDSAEFNKSVEDGLYFDANGNPVQSYDVLNNYQKIDWFRKKAELIIAEIESDEPVDRFYNETNLIFASMQLHDARVIFGHLLSKIK